MRLITLRGHRQPSPGVVLGSQMINLAACSSVLPETVCIPGTVTAILAAGDTALDLVRRTHDKIACAGESLREQLELAGALQPWEKAQLLAPIPDPALILAIGMNYHKHLREMGGTAPKEPIAFSKSTQAIIGPDAPIVLPKKHPDMVDWEAEFCAVIGRRCHDVSREEALDHVAGYTMVNDVSARNWIAPFGALQGMAAVEGWENNLLGKHFSTFCPMGPTVVTKDELPDPGTVRFELKVNGEVMQSACTDDLVFDVATLIAYYSRFYTFLPGDLITTGSPAGVGVGRKPRVFLKSGDVVTLQCDGVGLMRNPVVNSK